MQLLTFFRKHERYALLATAYADGQLGGTERSRFEAHLSTCPDCSERVAAGQALKASIAGLPTVPASRSFLLTPAMVADKAAQPLRTAIPKRIPMYLAVTRVAAGLAVVAFVSVFAASLLNGSNNDQQASEVQFTSKADSPLTDTAASSESAPNATDRSAAATPVPSLAPASGGAAEGQGLISPVASSPVPPERNSADSATTGGGEFGVDDSSKQPGVLGDPVVAAYDVDANAPGNSSFPWVIVLGSFAGAMVGLLYVFEARRRKRA